MNVMLATQPSDAAMKEDLAKSGLTADDLQSRPMEAPEKAQTRTPASINGYVLPYFDLDGKRLPYYRVRLFDFDPKYKQQQETSNHVYFPPGFQKALAGKSYVLLTEGEKKAALACKRGYPCCALGGVDSWRNRQLVLPADTELNEKQGTLRAKLPANSEAHEITTSLAIGMDELIHMILQRKLNIVIIYDTDKQYGTKTEVQRACAHLGYELRFRGIPFARIRQLVLPGSDSVEPKLGLDDYLLAHSDLDFDRILKACLDRKSAFPRHPDLQAHIAKKLQNPHLSRKELQSVSMAVLSDLDATGLRLRNDVDGQFYYFDYDLHVLHQADFPGYRDDVNDLGEFAHYLYRRFGLGSADRPVITWLGTQFTGEQPIEDVKPYKVLARASNRDDRVTIQISDGQFATVSARADQEAQELPGLEIYDNGDKGVLFEAGKVTPVDLPTLLQHYAVEAKGDRPRFLWFEVLKDVRLKDREKQSIVAALLYYISPWLYRWRGTQLPVEMIIGEAGSGKSSLAELRLSILTGTPKLRNAPQDLRDWHASLAHTGGLHVTDNLQLADKNLRQRLSDEICRLITEPNPSVEQRKLYTNTGVVNVPVQTVFAITAIQQPFLNADIIQRSIILELDKSGDVHDGMITYDSNWMNNQLRRFGGREGWLAHHFYVLHKFFQIAESSWDPTYRAKHRLINFEQCIMTMAKVFNITSDWIPDYLAGITNRSVTEADWVFQGLSRFAELARTAKDRRKFSCQDMSNFFMNAEDFAANEVLNNSRKLGRYMQLHKTMIMTVCRMADAGTANNRQLWQVLP